jgi:hypothetical protein
VRGTVVAAAVALVVCAWAVSSANGRTEHFFVNVAVTGPGHVSAPAPDDTSGSIECPSECSARMQQGSTVVFTANPDTGATFDSWGDDCGGSSTTCVVTIDGNVSISATFDQAAAPPPPPPPPPLMATLSVTKAGTGAGYVGGAGGIDCGPTCSVSVLQGTQIVLTAVPDDGSDFTGWSGGCSGTDTCPVTLDANTDVTATFTHVDRDPPRLKTMAASGAPGKNAALRFRVFDDSGKSSEAFAILQGTATIGRVTVPLGPVDYRHVYTAYWRVPARLKPGPRTFCGVASDAAGNRSTRSCSLLTVK